MSQHPSVAPSPTIDHAALPALVAAVPRARWVSSDLLRSRHDTLDFTALHDSQVWSRLAADYATDQGSRHLAVGGACALQHWSGDWLAGVLRIWAVTAALPDLDPARWWVRFDPAGRPAAIGSELTPLTPDLGPDAVAAALVEVLTPIVAAVGEATRIAERLAWASVTVSVAGTLSRLHNDLDRAARPGFRATLDAVVDSHHWPTGSSLDAFPVTAHDGVRLGHQRRTCCLIRLGRGGACSTCRDQPAATRHARMTEDLLHRVAGPATTVHPGLAATTVHPGLAATTVHPGLAATTSPAAGPTA